MAEPRDGTTSPKTLADRINDLTKVMLALTGAIGALVGLDQAIAKVFHKDSLLFSATGVGVSAPHDVGPPRAATTTDHGGSNSGANDATAPQPEPAPQPKPAPVAVRFTKPGGELYPEGGVWNETDKGKVIFTFVQQGVDDGYYVLFDATRNLTLRVPVTGGQVYWSNVNPPIWYPLYAVGLETQ
jgi:hypothetical protein